MCRCFPMLAFTFIGADLLEAINQQKMAEDNQTKRTLTTVGISLGVSLLVVGLYHQLMIGPIISDVNNVRQYVDKIRVPLNALIEKTRAIEMPSWLKKNDSNF